jgi:D-alanyl-D-alanine carboxypeptidase
VRLVAWVVVAGLVGLAAEERSRTFSFETRERPAIDTSSPEALATAAAELLARAADASGFRGCLGIRRGAELVFTGCVGADGATPLAPASRFSIASLWKQHVGLAVHERARDGRLGLEDRVDRWLPELAGAPAASVTIAQLLHMTSGLPFVISASTNLRTQLSSTQRSDENFFREARGATLSFPPGTRYQYSNVGYGLLALVLGRVDGRPWREVLAALHARAGMADTGFLTGTRADPPIAAGHLPIRCGVVLGGPCMLALPAWNYSMLPGGGTYSTVDDMLRWARVVTELRETDPPLYAAFTATTPESAGYASGWGYQVRAGTGAPEVSWYEHTGEDPGYFSDFWFVPSTGVAAVLLSCTDFTLDRSPYTLLHDVGAMLVGAPYGVMQ